MQAGGRQGERRFTRQYTNEAYSSPAAENYAESGRQRVQDDVLQELKSMVQDGFLKTQKNTE